MNFKCRVWDNKNKIYVLPAKLDMVANKNGGYAEFKTEAGRYELEFYTGFDYMDRTKIYEGDLFKTNTLDWEYVVEFDENDYGFVLNGTNISGSLPMYEANLMEYMGSLNQKIADWGKNDD